MRYDDWDVILFPRNSHVPIQEFKTACFVSQVEYGRQLPTLTCFITSLPPSTPFRISLHSWRTTLKASALLESQRKGNQKIVFAVQVIVGEARLFHGFFDLNTKWPQEIAYEKRSLAFNDLPSSQRKRPLEFPPFHNLTLTNNIWDARDPYGRIRVVLSEQLMSKTQSPGSSDFGTANELVCFSFQHAPKDILQQAGISWPISNPLYLPDAFNRDSQYSRPSPTTSWTPDVHPFRGNMHMQTPQLHNAQPAFNGSNDTEPKRHSNVHLPPVPHFPRQFVAPTSHNHRATTWDDAFSTLNSTTDTTSIDGWSEKRKTSASSDHPVLNYMYDSHTSTNGLPWMRNMSQHIQSDSIDWDEYSKTRKEKQFVVALRDDQLGQIIDAISPPKHNREISWTPGGPFHQSTSQQAAHAYYPPKFGTAPPTKRPSGVLARKSSYQDSSSVLRNVSNKSSSHKHYSQEDGKDRMSTRPRSSIPNNKEDIGPSQLRLPTPFPQANRVPTPNPFAQGQPATISELAMRGWPSTQASAHRVNRSEAPQSATEIGMLGSAHEPSNFHFRSRKEDLVSDSPKLSEQAARQDECLMPIANADSEMEQSFVQKAQGNSTQDDRKVISGLVEIIDIDAVDAVDPSLDANPAVDTSKLSPFKPSHKSRISQSSIDSTGRLERQLFSALGEELGSFDHHHHHQIDTTDMGPELMHALGGGTRTNSELSGSAILGLTTSNFEPAVKRKRQGMLGGGSNGSPMSKKEKVDGVESKEQREVVVSMRGD
ncbi:hypothetical protein COCCADRAFT_39088 [Bipolaris zeicola 26-R-13]|uniref:Uncharacterized protein n=1 Tax=Cochliobolus carbonum (strain 26-R-13) TaxID=930089 RepID=W6XZJ5_COCC2|nr:uncharacterized protein COCCADRAFT_39088 [Bipolaris zeicola 26-R-13]EUC30705.1 hypothetical protein COCCADRAFT_39088 [Bipolaris zeicola 26-R-13]